MVLYSHTVSCSIMALYLLGFFLGLLSLTVVESWWCDVQERKNTKPYFKIFYLEQNRNAWKMVPFS